MGHDGAWITGVSVHKHPETKGKSKPVFVVTDDFLEYKGRRLTPKTLDKLLGLAK